MNGTHIKQLNACMLAGNAHLTLLDCVVSFLFFLKNLHLVVV